MRRFAMLEPPEGMENTLEETAHVTRVSFKPTRARATRGDLPG